MRPSGVIGLLPVPLTHCAYPALPNRRDRVRCRRLPSHLQPYLAADSPLSAEDKRRFFTSVYLRAASAGNADTLEYLLSLPPDPALSHLENAAAARRFSLNAATLNNSNGSIDSIGLGLGGPAKRNGGLSARQAGKAREHDDDDGADGYGAAALALPDSAPRKWIDLEATDDDGNTALGTCVALGHAEAVRVLVESGVKVNQGDRGALAHRFLLSEAPC